MKHTSVAWDFLKKEKIKEMKMMMESSTHQRKTKEKFIQNSNTGHYVISKIQGERLISVNSPTTFPFVFQDAVEAK